MAVVLHGRKGDVQCLKALAAASAGSSAVTFKATDENRLSLVTPDASILHQPNSIMLALGRGGLCRCWACPHAIRTASEPQPPAVLSLLEWEQQHLRPALYTRNDERVRACLADLSQRITGSISLGHLAVACDLLAAGGVYASQIAAHANVAALIAEVAAQPHVQAAIAKLGGMEALQHTFAADSAAARDAQPKLPIKGQRNVLITSALPYVNNVPHLGNIIGCVLSADVYARYCRMRGYNTVFICGTDEYGTATETKALEEGLSCQEICDKYHAIHAEVYRWFDIAFDKFGRTPTRFQTQIAQSIFHSLQQRGCLVEQEMEQLFSEPLGKFLADRFVVGTCPKCQYEDARGDQCDACGSLLNPTELLNPRCKITGATPIPRTTRHIHLDLPTLTPALQAYIDATSTQGGWSSNCVQVTRAWMRDGLRTRCITRDLSWGTPVPMDGYESKVFYVWFDAPIGYISITADYCGDWEAWWKNPDDVELVQFMGKDNVPFHTVIFPATLLGTGERWTLMQSISVTEYLNYESGKFSKSRGVGVFGNQAQDTGIPSDVWRYYLLASRPEKNDTEFNWDDFRLKFTADLNDNLGNFAMRVFKFIQDGTRFNGVVPQPTAAGEARVIELGSKVKTLLEAYVTAMEAKKLREGLKCCIQLSALGNQFFQENEIWKLIKSDREACGTCMAALAGIVLLLAGMLQPFMPSTSASLCATLAVQPHDVAITDARVAAAALPHRLLPGHSLSSEPCQQLFFKQHLDEDVVATLRARFSGSQATDTANAAANTAAKGAAADGGTKGPKQAKAADTAAKAANPTGGAPDKGKGAAKAKNEKPKNEKPKNEKANEASAAPPAAAPDVSRLDLRVGLITKAWRHPDADSLYVEEIDVGEEAPRTVVSGLVKYIPEAEMQQRRCVLVCNMKPAKMRGITSQAMVLAASSGDGSRVELVEPPEGAPVGERVTVEGFDGPADPVLNPKHKVFEAVHPDLATNAACVACYRGAALCTSAGVCTVKSIVGGGIR